MLTRRRMMMQQQKAEENWDYILYPWNADSTEYGNIATKVLAVTTGQTIIIAGKTKTNTNTWLWQTNGTTDPPTGRTGNDALFRYEIPVVADGNAVVSGHWAYADGRQGTGGFFTEAYYIKIRIENP